VDRPNPTAGIGDISAKAMAGTIVANEVWHDGTAASMIIGRALDVEDQLMPNYSLAGGLSADQVDDVVSFLNSGPKITTFAAFDLSPNPVGYSFGGTTNIATGATLYTANCAGCHGADGTLNANPAGGLGVYFGKDGKYSEGFHKIIYGIANSGMTRAATGNLSGQQAANILAYIQDTLAPNYYKGGLVWDNYTKTGAGGTDVVPTTNKDFVRCKACHGWDGLGLDGGYVRRDDGGGVRPTPTAVTGNLSAIMGSPGVVGTVVAAEVWHDGTQTSAIVGRALNVEDQLMPDYSLADGLSAKQTADVVAFLNSGPKISDHAILNIVTNPVAYTFDGGTSAVTGATLYTANCATCHGADGTLNPDPAGGLGGYFAKDGKFSEGFHKITYGISNTSMTRAAAGNLTSQEAADTLAYIQANLGGIFP
jgi:mono/diheme cytochrome c family protein